MARRASVITDLMHLMARLPPWVGVVLAMLAYGVCHALSTTAPAAQAATPGTLGAVVQREFVVTFATFLQYLLPIACLAGASASYLRERKRARVFELASSETPVAIEGLSWREFESLIGEGFRRRGYAVAETGAAGADGGIDLVLTRAGKRYFVQCKHWKAIKVGVRTVRELYGVMAARRAAGGFLVTSGTFTDEARHFAEQQQIELIDGGVLAAWLHKRIEPEIGR